MLSVRNRLFVSLAALVIPSLDAQTIGGCPVFPSNNIWNVRVDSLPVHARSGAWVDSIGSAATLHQDFGSLQVSGFYAAMPVTLVTGSQPKVPITITAAEYESEPGPYPIPPDAKIEYGDRHVIVVDTTNCLLYETYDSYKNSDNSWTVYSGSIFDLRRNLLRPIGWTSSDAAGLPVLAGLVRYEEILEGEIKHALRFTAPRTNREYVWPARHFASSVLDPARPPMGARFRLKASFDISSFTPTTRIILTALKRYGMMLADNGSSWYMQGAHDSRWADLADEWRRIPGSAFEAVDTASLMDTEDSAAVKGLVAAPMLDGAALTPAAVTAGQSASLRLSLTSSAPVGGLLVALSSGDTSVASLSSSILIPQGSITVDVPVTTSWVAAQSQVVLTASLAGITRQATLTVNPPPSGQTPVLQSVTPSGGSGDQATFVVRTTDGDGGSDVARVDIVIGPQLDWATGCHIVYNMADRLLHLRTDTGAWVSAVPGSAGTLSNSRCSIDAAQVSNAVSGVEALSSFPFRFSSAFRGNSLVFARSYDRSGRDTTWRLMGSWSVLPPQAPTIASLLPAAGAGEAASFAATVSDLNGGSDVARLDLLIGPALDPSGCHISYQPARRLIYLRNVDGSWQSAVPGSPGILTNPRCSVDAALVSSSVSGTQASMSVPVRFASSFTGSHNVYVRAYDAGGLDSNWIAAGVWGVGISLSPPQLQPLTPSSGSGELANFVVAVSDPNGSAQLARVEILAGPALDNNGCHAIYLPVQNALYLRALDGSWQGGAPGSATTLSNARCSIDLRTVSRSVLEPVLSLTVPIRFGVTFTGNHTVYLRAANRLGLDTSWRAAGSWSR